MRPSSNEPAHIRPLDALDAAAAADLAAELGYPLAAETLACRLRERAGRPGYATFAALDAAGLVGWIDLRAGHFLVEGTVAEITGLIVAPAARGRGIGRALVARGTAWATGHGCSELLVRSRRERDGAHAFYRACGFHDVKTQLVFRLPLGDAGDHPG